MSDEYEEIQKLRQLWSHAIMTWNQIMIPLCAAIITFFVSQLPKFIEKSWGFSFLLVGWTLFTMVVLYWRSLVHHIDFNIVGMYPRMLELEREKNMETQADYYYRNLSKKSKKYLGNKLNLMSNEFKDYKFRQFKDKVRENNNENNPIDLLLELWDEYGWNSVNSRGHGIQNLMFVILIIIFLILILIGHYYYSFF